MKGFVGINTLDSILFSCFVLYNLATPCMTQVPLEPPLCATAAGNYTPTITYAANLNLTLISLASGAPLNDGFYSTSSGQAPNQVFGLLQCRGDISPQECQICANSLTSEILQRCQYQKEAIIYYELCWLRFADYQFFSAGFVQTGPELAQPNSIDAPDQNLFSERLTGLMNNLSSAAASSGSKFSGGQTSFPGDGNIYGMAQCVRNIPSEGQCLTCLRAMISYIPTCCGGKEGGRVMSKNCHVRFEVHPFLQSSSASIPSPSPLPPVVGSSPPPMVVERNSTNTGPAKGGKNILLVVMVVVAAVVLTSIVSICFFWRRARKRRRGNVEGKWSNEAESLIFDLTTLKVATKNFSDSYKLGRGGFGPVYRGKLHDGSQVAVKRLSQASGQGLEELKTEVVLVAKLMHNNLVRLLGFCLENEEKLLVYEYLPNGSLDQLLFDHSKRVLLDWKIRYKIVLGIAQGLHYLHHDSQLKIIHRDLKASNILLDGDMNAKVSDFGLARLLSCSQIQVHTNRIAGTFGYMAPEYVKNGHFSTKTDIFSFGILVLEIVTGKKNSSFQYLGNLTSYAWRHWKDGTILEMVDETLGGQWVENEALKCIHIALLCVQHDAGDRPTMSEVILMLSSYTYVFPVPSQPAFYYEGSNTEFQDLVQGIDTSAQTEQSSLRNSQQSANQVTISKMEPR